MRILAVDGNSIMNRAYYGIRPLTTKDGQFTHAIYGFLTMLEKIKADTNPDAVAIAFDLKAPTFRHKAYADYKGTRKGMPEELAVQVAPLKELLTLLGYKLVSCEGYEADDILGTFAKSCENGNDECIIATGDRDSLQLVSKHVSVRLASTKQGAPSAEIYDVDKVMEVYKVEPRKLIDIKALQGDTSDNIPGVAGIGPKGATELIKNFGSLDGVYENIDSEKIKEGTRKKLIADKDNAYLSLMLGEIYCDVPIDTEIEHYRVNMTDPQKAASLMARLELFKLIEKLGLSGEKLTETRENEEKPQRQITFKAVKDYSEIPCVQGQVADIQYSNKELKCFYVYTEDTCYYTDSREIFISYITDKKRKNIYYDSKPVYAIADALGYDIPVAEFDISLGAYLLNPSSPDYSVERLSAEYQISEASVIGEYDKDAISTASLSLPELYKAVSKDIKEKSQEKLLREIELPLAKVLARMENVGFAVDREGIEHYGEFVGEKLKALEQEIYSSVGYEFNINSPKQLGEALFVKLGLPAKKKTKSGYSTNAEVLEELRVHHPVVGMILQYRTYAKLKSTYCDGLLKVIAEDGRIHTSFNQKETRTGRISSTEPNLQNIPVRTELGRELRKFFVAAKGSVLVDADYSQIELRVLADISGDENMRKAFIDNTDIHTVTASQVFNMPEPMVTPLMRSRAKAVNFGIVYGIGAFSLAKDIGVKNYEAKEYIENYLAHYSGVDRYMKNVIEQARERGFVETVFGRRRYLPELTASNHITRSFGERVARNMPIQGTAADIIKIAMIRVDERLKAEGMRTRLILQVHDELIVEAPREEAMMAAMLLQEEMENAVKLSVPMVAEAAMGETWYDAKG
ncbi:MAG: DNA polymerase I [Eubacteriales bacterium]|nr:DNA polymerase I [Eubacteriales bacterium]